MIQYTVLEKKCNTIYCTEMKKGNIKCTYIGIYTKSKIPQYKQILMNRNAMDISI